MIYTITFNPSLDYIMHVDCFEEGETNRSKQEEIYPGGKGFNVSTILSRLNLETTALGFVAGFTGEEIVKELKERGFTCDLCQLESGLSRINVKMKGAKETEINGSGPDIPQEKLDELFDKLNQLQENDILVLAGSIPSSLPNDIYEQIMKKLDQQGIKIIVDATNDLLKKVLPYHPFLIKPNHRELEELFNVKIENKEDLIHYARKLQEQGAINVLVSLGKDGAILVSEDGHVYYCAGAKETEINGSGPDIPQEKLDELFEKLDHLKENDTLVLAGSIPSSLPDDIYEQIMKKLDQQGIKIIVDATNDLLKKVLPYHPFLIKPNHRELEELFNVKIENKEDLIHYARKLQEQGAINVLVSLGKDGAILVSEDTHVYYCAGAKGKLLNSVGSGDSMVAGFIAGYLKDKKYDEALKLGSACGGATAFSEDLAEASMIQEVYKQLQVEEL